MASTASRALVIISSTICRSESEDQDWITVERHSARPKQKKKTAQQPPKPKKGSDKPTRRPVVAVDTSKLQLLLRSPISLAQDFIEMLRIHGPDHGRTHAAFEKAINAGQKRQSMCPVIDSLLKGQEAQAAPGSAQFLLHIDKDNNPFDVLDQVLKNKMIAESLICGSFYLASKKSPAFLEAGLPQTPLYVQVPKIKELQCTLPTRHLATLSTPVFFNFFPACLATTADHALLAQQLEETLRSVSSSIWQKPFACSLVYTAWDSDSQLDLVRVLRNACAGQILMKDARRWVQGTKAALKAAGLQYRDTDNGLFLSKDAALSRAFVLISWNAQLFQHASSFVYSVLLDKRVVTADRSESIVATYTPQELASNTPKPARQELVPAQQPPKFNLVDELCKGRYSTAGRTWMEVGRKLYKQSPSAFAQRFGEHSAEAVKSSIAKMNVNHSSESQWCYL
ncbi:uncharacterized protein MONBRDRAFT_37272 [Monosiga brevicollis MX1]|uniref:Uncharacterized protein n=1 Tax=Monosiga brevicollis TaxID=81824 RepID=A9V0Q5_MONBE|nr:uncharacterized protein MONBRDRAFT_37272 [Monosiga brevicollis MX1]EDQ88678.1 predicted protein [Monosiga brevicollis MX1]|eukprot:XP_001746291.1 hypothetical protein [Monosiga brevicollis MX1]